MDLRAQELGSATKDSDGKRPAHDTKAVGAQYDRRAIRKLSAHNTTGALYGSCRRAIRPAEPTRTAPRAAALQGGQRCLRGKCALGAASGVYAAGALLKQPAVLNAAGALERV